MKGSIDPKNLHELGYGPLGPRRLPVAPYFAVCLLPNLMCPVARVGALWESHNYFCAIGGQKGIAWSRPTLLTLICAARAKMSAHETTPGHSFSAAALAASITSKPRSVRFGMASFSDGESMSTDPSHPYRKHQQPTIASITNQTAIRKWQVAAQAHSW